MELRPIFSTLLRNKTGALLIAAQIALSLAIVANALYIIEDRLALAARPSGVANESDVFALSVGALQKTDDIAGRQDREAELIRAVPGVVSVAQTNQMPLSQSGWNMSLAMDPAQTQETSSTGFYFGQHSLVETLGLNIIEGRDFIADDFEIIDPDVDRSMGKYAIVTKALADVLSPDSSVVGKTVYLGYGAEASPFQVVGVVERLQTAHAQSSSSAERSTIMAIRYLDPGEYFAVRAEPGQRDRVMRDVEAALLASGPGVIVGRVESMDAFRFDRYRNDRSLSWMLMTITGLLLLVTASGIVGMSTLWVTQRRKQIGVRRALGARRFDVLRYFITENLMISTSGIAGGLLFALILNQILVSQLELARLPLHYVGAGALILWLLGVMAVYAPAWRAASTSPAIATRSA